MKVSIPNLSLVVLIGPSGSGKSTFARKHFRPTEVLSSDACRGMVSDDEIVYTRTGRRFFNEPALEAQFLDRVRSAGCGSSRSTSSAGCA
jgi:serine kinase of HPr protein (carbohydrate metabolism regulator)